MVAGDWWLGWLVAGDWLLAGRDGSLLVAGWLVRVVADGWWLVGMVHVQM